jgi:alpha,alpha-trehalose phosphorylase
MKLVQSNNISPKDLFKDESIFATMNRMLGVRGNFAEGYKSEYATSRGTYINGIYDTYPLSYGEKGYGYPDFGQIIVNLPDAQTIYIKVNGKKVSLESADLIHLNRIYDLEKGQTIREAHYVTNDKYEFKITEKRMALFFEPSVFVIEYAFKSLNYSGDIEIFSTLDGNVSSYSEKHDPRVSGVKKRLFNVKNINEDSIQVSTKSTEKNVYCKIVHSVPFDHHISGDKVVAQKEVNVSKGDKISFTKFAVYTTDEYHANYIEFGNKVLSQIQNEDYHQKQSEYLKNKEVLNKVQVFGNEATNIHVNYNLYQLFTSGGYDSHHNIAAKGLSGEGYEGHYFWDTETYMFPYFLMTDLKEAYNLLMFRYNTLDHAKKEARKLGHSIGAKYPWRTINGDEVSSYYPAGTAQYHINNIIAYSFIQYFYATKDISFMLTYGFEVLYQTAIVFLEIGTMVEGRFHINDVTGPDEYSAIVNDNYYTNKMTQFHMNYVVDFYKNHYKDIPIDVDEKLIKRLDKAAKNMVLLYDEKRNINVQDDAFLKKIDVDINNLKRPLLLNYHPLTIYRMKVLKQADVILAHYLLDDEPKSVMKDSIEYYEKITTHDSSLSKCIYSIMHARLGHKETSKKYFNDQLIIDIDDTLGNTSYGLHIANMGGTYLNILHGFLGLRLTKEGLKISPYLPDDWSGYRLNFTYLNCKISIRVEDQITIQSTNPIDILVYEKLYKVTKEVKISLK